MRLTKVLHKMRREIFEIEFVLLRRSCRNLVRACGKVRIIAKKISLGDDGRFR